MPRLVEYPNEARIDPGLVQAKQLHRRIDLHCQRGGSDKVYIVYIYEDAAGQFQADGYYGRRGASLSKNQRGPFNSLQAAIRAGTQLANSKENGSGSSKYDKVNDENFSGQTMAQQRQVIGQAKQVATPSGTKLHPPLDLSQYLLPEFDFLDAQEAALYLTDPDYVMENIPQMLYWFFKFDALADAPAEWVIGQYLSSDGSCIDILPFSNKQIGDIAFKDHEGLLLCGFKDQYGLAIFDVLSHPKIKAIASKPWKVRRSMLSAMMDEFYPGRDPYGTDLPIRLYDYVYDDKDIEYKAMKGIVAFKHIDKPYSNDWLVTTKA